MSLHEVTTRSFQKGVGEQKVCSQTQACVTLILIYSLMKWGTLCRHVIAKNGTLEDEAGTEISSGSLSTNETIGVAL